MNRLRGAASGTAQGRDLQARKLHRGHFAFMRALAQGLDEKASWDRYLRAESEHSDVRTIRRTVAWVRDEFAAAARRENKPGTARLILLDPERFNAAPALPSLADFATAEGLEDFSEAEQLEAYKAAYPVSGSAAAGRSGQGRARPTRRARLIEHQLDALRWLENLIVQDPQAGDRVGAWLNPAFAAKLERAGLHTLEALVNHINGIGARWWVKVPGIGEAKAARIVNWLQANEAQIGLQLGHHVARPRSQLVPTVLDAVVRPATGLRPFEKFVLPAGLDGSAGCFRAPVDRCLLSAKNDHAAIVAWLASKRRVSGAGQLSATQLSYRREAERLLLWAILERKKAMSSLAVEDAISYREFLANPPASWCGPRHHQRWSPLWRPLEGPLSPAAMRQSLIIVKSLFTFLVSQGYVVGNPFAAVALPAHPRRPLGSSRMLTFAQWDHIERLLEQQVATEAGRRLRRGMRWLYATGLRLSEITSAKCADLERIDYTNSKGQTATGWLLSVIGKGERRRKVPIPAELIEELGDELARHGHARDLRDPSVAGIHVLGRFVKGARPLPWSSSGVYQAIKVFLAQASAGLDGVDAQRLAKSSCHSLRHTFASHALQERGGGSAVSLQVVQNNLGHASIATTSLYLATEEAARLEQLNRFWQARGQA